MTQCACTPIAPCEPILNVGDVAMNSVRGNARKRKAGCVFLEPIPPSVMQLSCRTVAPTVSHPLAAFVRKYSMAHAEDPSVEQSPEWLGRATYFTAAGASCLPNASQRALSYMTGLSRQTIKLTFRRLAGSVELMEKEKHLAAMTQLCLASHPSPKATIRHLAFVESV